jgi:hypothetical protein
MENFPSFTKHPNDEDEPNSLNAVIELCRHLIDPPSAGAE